MSARKRKARNPSALRAERKVAKRSNGTIDERKVTRSGPRLDIVAKPRTARPSIPILSLRAEVDSEVEAYEYIREQLRTRGWKVKNPDRHADGQVWTQNQCLNHPAIKLALGTKRPENVVKLSEDSVWIIEAKSKRTQLALALAEAEVDYARPIEAGGALRAPIISGVAGNDTTGYEVRTRLLVGDEYKPVTINGSEATGLPDPKTVAHLIDSGDPDIADFVIDETLFLKSAEEINRILHDGGINKNDRARVMAALLLALLEDEGLNTGSSLSVLIADINSRTEEVLRKHKKAEFHPFVHIEPPTNFENHVKFKAALIATVQKLSDLSIKSAMNSGADVLGKFYEVFLRYGNGAKEIGIVLTPRHITRFAVDAIGVGPTDVVYDPACGTGGFLVAAFDHVRKSATEKQVDLFKKHNLFGVERESAVAALAIVNMIFRGDGKNNIVEANCFSKFLHKTAVKGHPTAQYDSEQPESGEEPVTRVFMNPPFALKASDERESRFIEAALANMADGGVLFAVVPMAVMVEGGKDSKWRRDTLLAHHTLVAVVSLPEQLFYPVSIQTVALILRKGRAHPRGQRVFWARVADDGFQLSKGRRLRRSTTTPNDLDRVAPLLRTFIANPGSRVASVPESTAALALDYTDPILEIAPEAYLASGRPSVAELAARLDRQVRENVASLVDIDLWHGNPGRKTIIEAAQSAAAVPTQPIQKLPAFRPFALGHLFELYAGEYHNLSVLDAGSVPIASCTDMNNGIADFYNVSDTHIHTDALTIAFNGSPLTTKIHPYRFAAKDDVAVAIPKVPLPPEAVLFVQSSINSERWRYSYYRKCYLNKMGRVAIQLPACPDGTLDVDFMVSAVRSQPYWWFLAPRLADWAPSAAPAVLDQAETGEEEQEELFTG